jgi:hypothetical protein
MQAVDMQNLVILRGNVHPLARPEFDQGVAPDDLPLNRMLLVLQRGADQETALRQLLDQQQVKSSPQFHQWLTPGQFGQQFGPADSDLQAVTDWLTTQGFQVSRVSAGRNIIEFSGSAGLVREVLGTEIHRYRVNGEDHWANMADPRIPAALAPVVAGFASLNNFPRKPFHENRGTFSRSKATGEIHPLFTFPYGYGNYYALGPADFATIYNVAPLWTNNIDGTGQTLAVVGETNINIQDVRDFRSMFGLPANDPNIILNGPDPGITSGDESEADLDVEWSGAVAKGATIDLVVSESTETTAGIDLSALFIIDNNLAPVMSESYGECEAYLGAGGNQFYNTLWEQAAAEGITVLVAAGDSGSAGCDDASAGETAAQYGLGVSGTASTPFNVAVGGTDFNDADNTVLYWNPTNLSPSQSSAKSYIPESTWNDSCAAFGYLSGCTPPPNSSYLSSGLYLVAGAGGPSSCINPTGTFPAATCNGMYPKPSWQSGIGVPNDSARDIPDMSLFAGDGLHYSFYVYCQMDANATNGGSSTSCDLNAPYEDFQFGAGTSASTQTFAGIMALVNQAHGPQGNANYVLYPLAAGSGASCNSSATPVTNSTCIFYDVTVGNNSVICQGGSPNCSNTNIASGQYGIMVSGGLPAYNTTTGYDLATGLGSVNAANLVNNWTSNFTPSTATLALSTSPATNPITLTHGQAINFTIDVTSGSGTPAGDVSLMAHTGSSSTNVTGIGPFTLSGGAVSNSTIMLPGGSYNVTAHYAGNGTFAASDSTPGIPVTVSPESSQTEVRLVTFNSVSGAASYGTTTTAYGSPYELRMDVTNSSGNLCANSTTGLISYGCPTGSLTVVPAPIDQSPPPGTVPGQFKLNSQGHAEDYWIQLPPGQYPFVATYAGDNSYTASTSPTVPITITQATTTLASCSLPSILDAGTGINCLVTISTTSNGAVPTGTVQMMNNGAPSGFPGVGVIGSAYSNATGAYATARADFSTPPLPVGTASITFQYSGDVNYSGSTTSPAVTINVTDFTVSANPTSITIPAAGQSGNLTLTVTPVNGFTGTVNFNIATACPTGATCTISPPSVTVTGSSPVTAIFSIATTANVSPKPHTPQPRVPPGFRLRLVWPWMLGCLLALAALLSWAIVPRRPVGWLLVMVLLVVGVWVACGGGGGGGGGTPPPTAPNLTLSTGSLAFGQQKVGATSAGQSVTLTNAGNTTLNFTGTFLSGLNSGDFSQTSTCSNSLAASANCVITATFTPTGAGVRTASIVINDNSGVPSSVSLSGTGTLPNVGLSPSSLAFDPQKVGTTSSTQSVTLTNTGSAALDISNISLGGPNFLDFAETNTCGSILAAGANCAISATFTPTQTGSRSAIIYISDDAGVDQQSVGLSGTGTSPSTPPGNYSVQVNVVSGNDEHALTIPVAVQ